MALGRWRGKLGLTHLGSGLWCCTGCPGFLEVVGIPEGPGLASCPSVLWGRGPLLFRGDVQLGAPAPLLRPLSTFSPAVVETDNTLTLIIVGVVGGLIGLLILFMLIKRVVLFIIKKTQDGK